jgi:DNA replication and repair protein RecF
MAENGVAVAAARRETVERLNRAMAMGIGVFPRPAVAIDGTVEAWLAEGPALAAEDRLRALLQGSRRQDAEAGGAADGPHRSDLAVRHVDKDMPAALCSTGEQKALLVAIVLAAARLQAVERGAPPLLLLDEIAAHLDEGRRAALFDEITALGAQAWMTGTDRRLFDALEGRAQFFTVADGALAPDHDNRILQ